MLCVALCAYIYAMAATRPCAIRPGLWALFVMYPTVERWKVVHPPIHARTRPIQPLPTHRRPPPPGVPVPPVRAATGHNRQDPARQKGKEELQFYLLLSGFVYTLCLSGIGFKVTHEPILLLPVLVPGSICAEKKNREKKTNLFYL
jgi:hypothetical protein